MFTEIIIVFSLLVVSALVAVAATPMLTAFLYRHHLGKQIRDASETPIFSALHAQKAGTPTMAGVLVWGTTLVCLVASWIVSRIWSHHLIAKVNFWSRSETYLPIGILVLAALVGLVDDFYNVRKRGAHGGGLRARHRLLIYTGIALLGALWFTVKLGWTTLHVPYFGNFDIGLWYIPLFVLVIVATSFSVNETDGLDGLAGGTMLITFSTFGVIAFLQGKYDLVSLIAVIVGSLSAFLWFNIPPARFMMGDTGAMSLGVTLGVLAMLTNTIVILPLLAFPFVIESASVLIQLASKKFRKKKVFISSPLHHHLEAKGWSEPKIVMRFWILGAMAAIVGLIIFFTDRL